MSKTVTEHTPGPWNLSANEDGRTYVEASNDTADDIAALLMDHDQQQNAANARLIAAAPDLLAACKAALNTPAMNADEMDPIEIEAVELARAAIRKAEGGAE